MTLRLFYIFKKVYECTNISEAAKQLYMSQPAVSHAMKELEDQVSLCLFERIGKRIYRTEAGTIFYFKTCQLLAMYEEIKRSSSIIQDEVTLRIGSSITNANVILPKLLSTYQKLSRNPVKVVVDNAANIEQKLLCDEIDFALLEGPQISNQLIIHPLESFELLPFYGKDYAFKQKNIHTLKDLWKEAWLMREKGSAIRDTLDGAFLLQDIIVEPIWISVNSQSIVEAVKQGLGISLLPRNLIEKELEEESILPIPLQERIICANHLVYHKDKHIHKAMRQFLDLYETIG